MSLPDYTCPTIKFDDDNIIVLVAKSVHRYICEWHLDSFARAIFLGTPVKAIKTIAGRLGLAEDQIDAEGIVEGIGEQALGTIPPLGILTTECNVAITDCVVNNVSGSRRFGIGLEIDKNNRIGAVTVDGVGLQITLTPKK